MPLLPSSRSAAARTGLAMLAALVPTGGADAQPPRIRAPLASASELARASETIVPYTHCQIFSAAVRETLSTFGGNTLSLTTRTSLGRLLLNERGELYCGGTSPIAADRVIRWETDRDLGAIESLIRRANELARDRGLISHQDVIDAREGRRDFFFTATYGMRPADRPSRPAPEVGSVPERRPGPSG
jgi:hypothetical protein